MTVGYERAHPQLLGEGEGLTVVAVGLFGVWKLALGSNLPQEPQRPGFMTPFFAGPDDIQGLPGQAFGLLQAAGPRIRLTLPKDAGREGTPAAHGRVPLRNLLKQRQGLGQAPRERIP